MRIPRGEDVARDNKDVIFDGFGDEVGGISAGGGAAFFLCRSNSQVTRMYGATMIGMSAPTTQMFSGSGSGFGMT